MTKLQILMQTVQNGNKLFPLLFLSVWNISYVQLASELSLQWVAQNQGGPGVCGHRYHGATANGDR